MSDKNIVLSAESAEALIKKGNGLAALLYLHIRARGEFSLSAAARELGRSAEEISMAAAQLREMGLMKIEQPLMRSEMPDYTPSEIVSRANRDDAFDALVDFTQRAQGKLLSVADMQSLYGIYDHLGIPAEVIMLLVSHCHETYKDHYGQGRIPTMRYIEKEAWYWAGQEIMSLEAAEEHIRFEKERKTRLYRTKELLQILGRALSPTEKKYIESWLDMGFEPEALAIAYDRTVVGTGRLTWRYMDKIVRTWDEKGLHSAEAVESGDPRLSKKSASKLPEASDEAKELDDMRRMYAHLKDKES